MAKILLSHGSGGKLTHDFIEKVININGVIFLAVMIALWGLVSIVLTFVFGTSSPFNIPGGTDVPRQEGGSGPGPGPGPGPIQT